MNTFTKTKQFFSFVKKKRIIFFILMLGAMGANAQFAVTTNGGSGLAPTYGSLAAAITALNGATISSPVIITCPTGTETSPAGGYSITANGTSTNTIIIQGNGAANSIITAPNPAGTSGALTDAIFKIIGGDYITIQGFAMNENSLNLTTTAASNNMTEFGVALFYNGTTNGAQNNTIQNNTITLNRTYQNTWGIYSNSTHSATVITTTASATTVAGANSNLKIYGNTISNVNQGICVVGPTAAADMNTGIDIGGTSAPQGNSITNWGTTGTFSGYVNVSGTLNGILVRNSFGFNVSFNTITSSVGGNTVTTTERGIYVPSFNVAPTGTFTNTINNNNISIQSGFVTGTLNGIINETTTGTATSTLNINSNNFNTFGHTAASPTGACIFINNTMAHFNLTINSNTFTNISLGTTGSVTFISHSYTMPAGGSQTISGNSIVGAFSKTGAGGTVTCTTSGASSPNGTFHATTNNNFSNITVTGATTIQGTLSNDGSGTSPQKTFTGNTYSNWTGGTSSVTGISYNYIGATTSSMSNNTFSNITGQGAITAISIGNTFAGATTLNIASNTITNLTSTGTGGAVTGISCSNASTTININNNTISTLSSTSGSAVQGIVVSGATTNNVFKNTICDLSGNNASTTVNGINVSAGTTVNVSNNRIGDLRASTANAANPVVGINIGGGTTVNCYYNTVNLNATSSGALFGSSAISASTSPTLNLNNNIFVNTSTPNGATGFTVAYRRSSTTLTTYVSTSNRNLFYAGAPSTNNLIHYDGTNSFQTIAAYKAMTTPATLAPRDANSISENPPFLSTTCGSANFLKINTSTQTGIESGGANISGITDDFENDIRHGNAGTASTGTAPDLGADEFNGTPLPLCTGTPAASTISGVAAVCANTGTTLTLSSSYSDIGIGYQWLSSTTPGGPYTTTLGSSATQATGNLSVNTYYVCTISCSFSGLSYTTAEKSVLVNALPSVSVSPTSGAICNPGGTAIALTAGGASTYAWSPSSSLSASTGSPVNANPTSTTIYTVTGTDGNGCIATSTATIAVTITPQNMSATATPSTICSGATSNLTSSAYVPTSTTVNNYTFSTSTGATVDPMVGATTVVSASTDDAPMNTSVGVNSTAGNSIALPFTFNYNGVDYTHYAASPDGWVKLGTSTAAATAEFTNVITSTSNIPRLAPYWDDLATGTDGWVKTVTTGTSPNRIFKVEWKVTIPRNTTGASNSTFQLWMYETTNIVEFRYGTMGVPTSTSISGGLAGSATQFQSLTFATNTSSSVTANDANATTAPASGRMYTFAAPSLPLTYAWQSASNVVNASSQNTVTNPLTATTTFTVTASNGVCSATATATVSTIPLTCSAATITGATCAGANFTATANINGGGAPYTYAWSDGSATVYPTTSSVTVNLPAGTYTLTCTVGDACGASCASSVVVTVNALPSVNVSPSSGLICAPGGSAITLTTSGAATYAWSPTTGLTPTSGSPVSANPSSSTTYTVSGTDANGCISTSTAIITVSEGISILSGATATPSTICSGANSQLNYLAATTSTYSVQSTPYLFETPSGTPLVIGTTGDDVSTGQSPLPFGFNYFGITYTDFVLYSNGFIQLGTSSGSTSSYGATFPTAAAPNNIIAGVWDDLNITGAGSPTVRSFTNGTAPNRVFILEYSNIKFYNSAANNGNATFQIKLFETSNKIEVHIANLVDPVPSNHFIGIENSGGTIGYAPVTRNPFTTDITTPEAWKFTPSGSSITYAWSPSTFITGQESLSNPLATAVNANTTYTVTASTSAGCSASATTSINVNPIPTATISGTTAICNGGSAVLTLNLGGTGPWLYEINGNLFSSTVSTFTVSVNPTTTTTYSITAFADNNCNGTTSGTAEITVNEPSITSTAQTACDSYQWPVNSVTYTAGGTYINTYLNGNGCLSSDTLFLTINHSTTSATNETACDSYNWFGTTYTASGDYTHTNNNAFNCLNTDTLHLTINHSTTSSTNHTACDNYNWFGTTYTTSGTYTHTNTNGVGCVNTDTLHLTINYSTTSSSSVTACNSYTWNCNGLTYTSSGAYTCTSLNGVGCVNTATLNLTINVSTTNGSITATACDSYGWSATGLTYTASGIYTKTTLNAAGCVNTATLTLTINSSTTTGSLSVTACDSYTWSATGLTYTTSGVYTKTSINAAGCINTATLTLTINASTTTGSLSATACDSYTWSATGLTYTASGIYTKTTLNGASCVNTATLTLTINASTTTGSLSVTACDSYTWSATGLTYTASGTYTKTSLNAAGCVNTATLTLTINASTTTGSFATTACDSYTWSGTGLTYTASGVYTKTTLNGAGCVNTATLTLTINSSTTTGSFATTACDSYTWSATGLTYSASGVYTKTTLNGAGCVNTATLTLTITNSTTASSTISSCGAYTWFGTTYTNSGVYTHVTGCHTDTLHLSIITTFTYNSTVNSLGCYTWSVNGATYTADGTYTYTTTNISTGCAETYNLYLTITPGLKLAAKAILAGPYDASLGLMHDSLRVIGQVPSTEPYSYPPFNKPQIGDLGGETVTPAVLGVTGPDAIVDWVFLELRSASVPATIVSTKRALIQRDGDIVSNMDGTSPVFFSGLPNGNYYVSIKHRNHLGVMTATPIALFGCAVTTCNFTSGTVYSMGGMNAPRKTIGLINALWSADCNNNKNVKYNGLSNDKDYILTALGGVANNELTNVYRTEDANMDGKIRYNNADNDRVLIINNLGVNTPNNIINQHTPN